MKSVFGPIVAAVLLAIYCYLVWTGVEVVSACGTAGGCQPPANEQYNDQMASSLILIGGLVSALVIAVLAATKPGEAPGLHVLSADQQAHAGTRTKFVLRAVTGLYLTVWLVAGLSAFFVGYLWHPNVLPALTDLGQGWLGIAVGAGYAYFGIDRK